MAETGTATLDNSPRAGPPPVTKVGGTPQQSPAAEAELAVTDELGSLATEPSDRAQLASPVLPPVTAAQAEPPLAPPATTAAVQGNNSVANSPPLVSQQMHVAAVAVEAFDVLLLLRWRRILGC